MTARSFGGTLMVCAVLLGCSGEGTGPGEDRVSVAVQSGDAQFGAPGATVLDPLRVILTDPVDGEPVENVTVTWRVTSGSGATLTPPQSVTNEQGVASTALRLGTALGDYQVEATTASIVGSPARFTARAVNAPTITSAPAAADVGETITITGTNFSPQAGDNLVLFGGFRAQVVSATATELRAVVPACVPARTVPLTVSLGAVAGTSVTIEVRGSSTTSLQLARGEVLTISDPAALNCFRLPGGIANYSVLLVPQNFSAVTGSITAFQINGLYAAGSVASITSRAAAVGTTTAPLMFETKLRLREQQMLQREDALNLRAEVQPSAAAACPTPVQVGNQCSFQVINRDDDFVTVNAELKAISTRALIYQDVNSPANGLTTENFQTLATTFDDPIYSAVSGVYGTPTDIDNNGRVIILLTPVVNAMTTRGASGFIAGFFYGCDLVTANLCSGTNRAEIFYTLTADPAGQFSDARNVTTVMRALPPVLGHEFQHMISFGHRNNTDALWLSEGLAHHAEDVVADVFESRGDATNASLFRVQNYTRADRYLRDPAFTSLISEGGTGTLELRGAGWLFVKYLVGQFGESILRELTQSSTASVTNVVQQTGRSWSSLLANWAVALYADDAPELAGAVVQPEYTFPNINLRATIFNANGYSLRPAVQLFEDFTFRETLPASSQAYLNVRANGTPAGTLNLNLAGQYGGVFPTGSSPQLSIMRLQ